MADSAQAGLESRLQLLNEELAEASAEAELCLVGGAVVLLCYDATPETRRVRALFRPVSTVTERARAVAERLGLSPDWLNDTVRRVLVPTSGADPFVDRPNVRVFSARGDYVLAMKCASLPVEDEHAGARAAENDLRYLLRYLDLDSAGEALSLVGRYLQPRHLPDDLEARIRSLLV